MLVEIFGHRRKIMLNNVIPDSLQIIAVLAEREQ